jgi:phage tail-like protein
LLLTLASTLALTPNKGEIIMVDAWTQRTDPLRNFKFRVSIDPVGTQTTNLANTLSGIKEIGFAQVSGLAVSNQEITYREGGMNTHPHRFVGQSDFTPVAFARGVFSGQKQLWEWQRFMHSWSSGGVTGAPGLSTGDASYRCNITVKVYDHPHTASGPVGPTGSSNGESANQLRYANDGSALNGTGQVIQPGVVKLQYKLFNCWPGSYSLSDLSAGDTTGIMVQTMNVYHEGFYIDWTGNENLATIN